MELDIIHWIQSFHTPLLDQLFILITMLGEETFYILVLGFFYWCVDKHTVRYFVLLMTFSGVLNAALKEIVNSSRPFMVENVRALRTETAGGSSFPSGHTQTVTVFYGALAHKINKLWGWILAVVIILSVGISRVYLGVHWPKDVVGGILLGILSIVFMYQLSKISNMDLVHKIYLTLVAMALASLTVLHSETYLKAVGAFTGFMMGYFIESLWIQFNTKGSWKQQVLKFIVAIVITLGVFEGLKIGLPAGSGFKMLRYFVTLLLVTAGVPWLFQRLKLSGKEEVNK